MMTIATVFSGVERITLSGVLNVYPEGATWNANRDEADRCGASTRLAVVPLTFTCEVGEGLGDKPVVELNYHQGAAKAGVDYDAGKLLESMRENVEHVLTICATRFKHMSTCTSQSVRAIEAVDYLTGELRDAARRTITGMKMRRILRNFLAVHKTVEILETNNE